MGKINTTTVLGFLFVIGTLTMLFLDMNYSLNKDYSFELSQWHIVGGVFCGLSLILLPEENIRYFISEIINKWLKK